MRRMPSRCPTVYRLGWGLWPCSAWHFEDDVMTKACCMYEQSNGPRIRHAAGVIRNQRGQALAEAAIGAIVTILLVAGVIEWGRAFMVANMITHAASDGARAASIL